MKKSASVPVSQKPSKKCLEKKRKDYAFWRQYNEKPSIIPGCPGKRCLLAVFDRETVDADHRLKNGLGEILDNSG